MCPKTRRRAEVGVRGLSSSIPLPPSPLSELYIEVFTTSLSATAAAAAAESRPVRLKRFFLGSSSSQVDDDGDNDDDGGCRFFLTLLRFVLVVVIVVAVAVVAVVLVLVFIIVSGCTPRETFRRLPQGEVFLRSLLKKAEIGACTEGEGWSLADLSWGRYRLEDTQTERQMYMEGRRSGTFDFALGWG